MYRFIPYTAALGYVSDVDTDAVTEVVDEAGQQLSALQNFLIDAAPSIRSFIFNLIVAVIIFIVGKKLVGLAVKILERFLGRTGMDAGVSAFLVSTARALMYVLLAFVIVGQLGVNTASIVTLLGTAGIAIGMSLQGSLSNVAGGILILLMKPFRVGDFVSTSYGDGTVKMIGLVYTVITTVDNRALTIPNGALSNSAVFNANAAPERRLDIAVGISYDSDIALAKQIMEDVYRDCPGFIPDRDLNVHVSGLEDSSVTIEGFGWVRGSEFLKSKWYVLEEVKLRYDAQGVTIPFPQVDVHLDPS